MQSQTAILSFKGLPLQLSVRASRLSENGSFLQISLQGQRTADHQARGGGGPSSQSRLKNLEYFNQFTPQYVENMTLKTGNFKKFSIFIEMLFSALEKSSNTVTLDILTIKDLQRNAAQQDGRNHSIIDETHHAAQGPEPKLYLIITYSAAFDRVHYPLPLILQDEKSYDELYAKYLEAEKDRLASVQEMTHLMKENDRLKHLLKANHQNTQQADYILKDKELNSIQSTLLNLRQELQTLSKSQHHRIHSQLSNIVDILSTKVLPPESLTRTRQSSTKSKTTPSSKPRNSSTAASSEKRNLSRSLNSVASKPGSTYGSFGPAPRNNYTKSPSLDRSRPRKAVSASPSRSPFRRFDPTQYVLEKEARLEERRSRSKGGSRSNSLTKSANSTTTFRSDRLSSPYENQQSNKKNYSSSSRKRSPTLSKDRLSRPVADIPRVQQSKQLASSGSGTRSIEKRRTHSKTPRDNVALDPYESLLPLQQVLREPEPDAEKIDQRLAQLQLYLEQVMK